MRTRYLTILIAPLLLLGCGEEPVIQTYEVDKPAYGTGDMVSGPVTIGDLVIDGLDGWVSGRPSQFVLADFRSSEGLKLTVSVAGGDLRGNIDRWRGQLGLAPLDGALDPSQLETVESAVGPVWVVDLVADEADAKARRFRVGLLAQLEGGVPTGQVWFFKLDGPSGLIEAQRGVFDGVLKRLRWAEEGAVNDG